MIEPPLNHKKFSGGSICIIPYGAIYSLFDELSVRIVYFSKSHYISYFFSRLKSFASPPSLVSLYSDGISCPVRFITSTTLSNETR